MSLDNGENSEIVDIAIIGAGISGIGTAIELERREAAKSVLVLEAREAIGGTWDLFRYPGVRSDSDVQTFSYEFKPWEGDEAVAPGGEILDYIREAAREYGIEEKIRFGHRVVGANWDSEARLWEIDCEVSAPGSPGEGPLRTTVRARWFFNASGYYRYDRANEPELPGRENFRGQIIHPQYWPADLDYSGKRIVVLGSGATAITLIPALAEKAASVTMLQRTPSYVLPLFRRSPFVRPLIGVLGPHRGHRAVRRIHIAIQAAQYAAFRRFPRAGRAVLKALAGRYLPDGYPYDVDFNPPYDPWDQRLCISPGGDFYRTLAEGKAEIVTDHLDHLTPDGVLTRAGRELPCDLFVTATGFILSPLGGIALSVDGDPVDVGRHAAFKGMMLSDVPNLVFAVGYTNSSWTLKIGLLAAHFARLLDHMDSRGADVVTPRFHGDFSATRPLLDFGAGYIKRDEDRLPRVLDSGSWTMGNRFVDDRRVLTRGRIDDPDLEFR